MLTEQDLKQFYTFDPLLDPRWDELIAIHPQASVFHRSSWLRALARTYGYRPIVLTSSPPGKRLSDGIVFCEIKSWITGSRLVSLPFSDHVEPLLNESEGSRKLEQLVQAACSLQDWKYVELRPAVRRPETTSNLRVSESFWLHNLSLAPPIEQLLSNTHKSSFQRRIRHAEHEHLEYERGVSQELSDQFYELILTTRKRHRLLPQPQLWFTNLISEMGPDAEIRLARKEGSPIAAIFTLRHRDTIVYKYGCSDHRFHHLAGMPFLLWRFIEESKSDGLKQIDFGRTDIQNNGLVRFKDRLGATRTMISYLRYPQEQKSARSQLSEEGIVGNLLASLPRSLSSRLGQLVYRHVG